MLRSIRTLALLVTYAVDELTSELYLTERYCENQEESHQIGLESSEISKTISLL